MGGQKGLLDESIFSSEQPGSLEAKIQKRERECIFIRFKKKKAGNSPREDLEAYDQGVVRIHSMIQLRKHPASILWGKLRDSLSIPIRMR